MTQASDLRYGIAMHRSGSKLQEMVWALGVLALVFLNFGHAPMAAATGLPTTAWTASYCGAPIGTDAPGDGAAVQCDVCLIGSGFDLPPAPPALAPDFGAARVAYPAPAAMAPAPGRHLGAQPRAPPAV